MRKVAMLMIEGFEESETLTITDLLRRCGIQCDLFYFDTPFVKGMQGMWIEGDLPFGEIVEEYDMIVLPGGRPGGQNLLDHPDVIKMVQSFDKRGKEIGAMCSGTIVLEQAGVIRGRSVTGYRGYAEKLGSGTFLEKVVVSDQNLITSQGPATPYPFAFEIARKLGVDPSGVIEKTLFSLVADHVNS